MVDIEIEKYYLLPSSLFASERPHMIDTILGSCVAVCFYDTKMRIGGINHFMLPLWNGEGLASPKYGNIANEKLLEKMQRFGCKQVNMVAKVFGGANQINTSINIGDRNVAIAKQQLEQLSIKIISESTGGNIGRKLRYNSETNEVLMRFLNKQ